MAATNEPCRMRNFGRPERLQAERRKRASPRRNENSRWTFQDDLVDQGRHNLKFGFFIERDGEHRTRVERLRGHLQFRSQRGQPAEQLGNGYAKPTRQHELHESAIASMRRTAHWQRDGYAQDSWKHQTGITLDYGSV